MMDKVIRWLVNYWTFIVLIIMILGTAYLSALDEKKTASQVEMISGQTIIELIK